MKRVILGAILAGAAVFIWGMVSHMLLPIGEVGVKMMPNETAVVEKMKENITAPGVYLFPGYDTNQPSSKEAEKAWAQKYEAGPNGFLVYQPQGTAPLNPFSFLWELLASMMGALLSCSNQALKDIGVRWERLLLWAFLPGLQSAFPIGTGIVFREISPFPRALTKWSAGLLLVWSLPGL